MAGDDLDSFAAQMQSVTNALLMDSPDIMQSMNLGDFYNKQREPLEQSRDTVQQMAAFMAEIGQYMAAGVMLNQEILKELRRLTESNQAVARTIENLTKAQLAPRKGRRMKDGTLVSEIIMNNKGNQND